MLFPIMVMAQTGSGKDNLQPVTPPGSAAPQSQLISQSEAPEGATPPVLVLFPCGGKEGLPSQFRNEYRENLYQNLVTLELYDLAERGKIEDAIRKLNLTPSDLEQKGGIELGKAMGANLVVSCFVNETTGGDKYLISLKSRSIPGGEEKGTASGELAKIYEPDQMQALNENLVCQLRKCNRVQAFQRKRLMLVVDSSNSMRKFEGNDVFNRRRSGAKLILNYIKRFELTNVELGIIDFSDRVHFSVCPQNVFDHFQELDSAADRIGARGGETNFDVTLKAAYDCLKDTSPEIQNFIFFLTDGFHNIGEYQNAHRLFNPKFNPELKNGIPIFVMGLGADVKNPSLQFEQGLNEVMLSRIARESGGKDYLPIFSAADIQAVFMSLVELEVMYRKGVASAVVKGVKRGKKKSFQFQGGGDIFIYVEEKSEFSYEVKDPKGNQIVIAPDGKYQIKDSKGKSIEREKYPPVMVSIVPTQASFIRLEKSYYGKYEVAIKGESGIPKEGTNLHYIVSTADKMSLDIFSPAAGYVHGDPSQDIHFQLGLVDLPKPIQVADVLVSVYKENKQVEEFPFGPFSGGDSTIDFFYSGAKFYGPGHYRFKFEVEGKLNNGIQFQRFRESNIIVSGSKPPAAEKPQEVAKAETPAESPAPAPEAVSLPEGLQRIYFIFDHDTLSAEARPILQDLSRWLSDHPLVRIRLEGHCDEVGTRNYNQELGIRRAARVKNFLVSQAAGLDPSRIEIVSRGKEEPLVSGPSFAVRWKNRRVEVKILPAS
ncbi:MAG: OmpA family protein [bacterium]|nr:OmpA family protein [bacterium]